MSNKKNYARQVIYEHYDYITKAHTIHWIDAEFMSYNDIKSLNAFQNRMTTAYLKYETLANKAKCNYERIGKLFAETAVERGATVKVYGSVQEFYDSIGYDHRRSTANEVYWK